jgi:hypothetical protein
MAELFSKEWSKAFMDAWNADEALTASLQKAGFNSVVAFGLPEVDEPAFVMTIKNGVVGCIYNSAIYDV